MTRVRFSCLEPTTSIFSTNSIMCNVINQDLIEGNDTPFENQLKTLNFPNLYLCKDFLGLLKLLKFIKSDFAANFEDYMSFNTELNGNKTQFHRYKR